MSTSTSDFSSDKNPDIKNPDMLAREIEQKRATIDNIVSALENKLSPGEIVDTALNFARGNGGEFLGNLGRTLKANPLPTLLTSVGVLWMIVGQNRRREPADAPVSRARTSTTASQLGTMASEASSGLSHKAQELKQQSANLKAKGEQLLHGVGSTLGSTRERITDSASHAAQSLRHQADRARSGYEHLLHEQPLVLGAVGLAVGALLGASLPRTQQEDRLLGATSDAVTRKARDLAEQGYAKAESMVKDMVKDEASDPGTAATGTRPPSGTSPLAASQPNPS